MRCQLYKISPVYKFTAVLIFFINLFVNDIQGQLPTITTNTVEPLYRASSMDTSGILKSIRSGYQITINHFDSGVYIIKEGLARSINSKFYPGIFEAYLALGIAYTDRGDTKTGTAFYQQAFFYSKKTPSAFINISRVINNLGNLYLKNGKYENAAECFYNAAMFARQDTTRAGLIQLGIIYNNMVGTLIKTDQYQKGLEYLDKAEQIRIKSNSPEGLAHIYNNKATVYKRLGNMAMAKQYYEKAMAIASKYNNEQSRAISSIGFAELLVTDKEYEKAIPILKSILASKSNINPYYKEVGTMQLLGATYLLKKQYKEAEMYLLIANEKAKLLNTPDYILKTDKNLAALYEQIGRHDKAFIHLNAFMTLYDSILNKEKSEAVNELEVKYRTVEKDKKILEDKLLIKKQSDRINNTNRWIIIFSSGIAILLVLSFSVYRNIQNKRRLQEATIRELEQQQEINTLKALMQGEEKERTRIAQELHDGIGGTLAAVKMNFTAVQNDHPFLVNENGFQNAVNMLNDMTNELRHTAHNLMPEMLMQHGLPEAINMYCQYIKKGNELTLEFQTYGAFDNLSNDFILFVYRIMQELIHNIVKHSKATHAIVQLSHYENLLTIAIEDNGVGFTSENKGNGMGLYNLQSRVKKLNGTFNIDSSEQKGTAIYIEFDLEQKNTEVV